MKMRICTKCKIPKSLDSYHKNKRAKDGFQLQCKSCAKEHSDKRYQRNKIEILAQNKEWRDSHSEYYEVYGKEYYSTEIGKKVSKKSQQKRTENGKNAEYVREKRKTDLNFKIKTILRNRLYQALKGNSKSAHTTELLSCSIIFFLTYIESQFESWMSWDSYGILWDLDHYIPCAYFDLSIPENQFICFNYLNLRPLCSIENRKIKHHEVPSDAVWWIENIKKLL